MKLQTLKQGDKSVEAYYQELLIFCHVVAYMRMIRLFLLDFWVVGTMIQRIFLIRDSSFPQDSI
jgi:hypothetical protein